jgi:hypothetical protein
MKRYQTLAKISMLIVLGALIVLFTGCKDEEEGTASLSVSLESFNVARTTYDAVNIDIQSASIHTSTNADETSGWFELPTYTGIYDLLDYEAGNDTIIALEPFLELQTVSQIRLILGHENTIVVDGMTYDLDTPSAQSSGLKIQIHADLQPNMAYKVVLNFDVDKSIVNTGNNKYKLLPVINASVAQVQ